MSATPSVPPGLLCIRKPSGVTSRDVVNVVQRLVRPAKVGHAGTLDPLATGVLVIAVGAATRLVRFVQDQPKTYRGTFELGLTTDTEDITGTVLGRRDPSGVTADQLRNVINDFRGTIAQVPPQYSALHVQGQRAYDLARKGIAVELESRTVEVYSLEVQQFFPPHFTLDVICSGGTYIRSLGRDIGERLGCGAAMTALERTAIGPFTLERAISVVELSQEAIVRHLWPPIFAVEHLPRVNLAETEVAALCRGQAVPLTAMLGESTTVAAVNEAGELVAVGETRDCRLQPRVVP